MISIPLSDAAWRGVEHLFPNLAAGRGRPRRNERDILNAILWLQQTGEKWHRLPGTFPPQQTCYQRYISWKKLGILVQVTALLEAAERGTSVNLSEWLGRGNSTCSRGSEGEPREVPHGSTVDWCQQHVATQTHR